MKIDSGALFRQPIKESVDTFKVICFDVFSYSVVEI